jgi:hypothetical protein
MRNSQKDFCFFKTRHGLQIRANWGDVHPVKFAQ